jgi:regulator of protease activity HflC (stomatin/prohibitin superfamily)
MDNNKDTVPDLEQEEGEIVSRRSYLIEVLIILMVIIFTLVVFKDLIFVNIPAGHKGVLFRTLEGGTVTNRYYDEGLVFVFPWNQMIIYDTRILSGQDTIAALTADGLPVQAEISYRYRPTFDSIGLIHKNLGLGYKNIIIIPHVTSATRDVVSRYRVDALFSTSRKDIQDAMLKQVKAQVDSLYPLTILDLVVRDIKIEKTVEDAIANKLVQEQEMLAYNFILQKEQKELERKLIEARGIKLFRDASGINIMQWKGIEATRELAKSPNTKVIVLGQDGGKLPFFLGHE